MQEVKQELTPEATQAIQAQPQQGEQILSQRQQDELILKNNPEELLSELQKYRTYVEYRGRDTDAAFLERVTEMVIPLALFLVAGIVLGKFFQNRHRERMQIIERGLDPVAYRELYAIPKFKFRSDRLGVLKWGLLAIFVGIGAFIGDALHSMSGRGFETDFYYPVSMLISGGIGLIVFYFIASKYDRENKANNMEINA
jgi:hypothetical protein